MEEKTKYKEKVIEILKQPLIYIIIVCSIFQVIAYSKVSETRVSLDSTTYIAYAKNTSILRGQVDEKRTPVYPYLVKLILKIGGEENLPANVATVQKFFFVITLILFYVCVASITKNKLLISFVTLIFGIAPAIIMWNVPVLTEALSITEMVILALMTIQYLKKPRKILAGSVGIMILIMIMTRPSFIYLLPIYLLFWGLRFIYEKEERTHIFIGVASCIFCAICLLGYSALMNNQFGEFALTRVSNLNNVVSAIQSNSYKNASNEEMIKDVDAALAEGKNMWDTYEVLAGKYTKPELKEFASSSLKSKDYLQFLLKKTVNLGGSNIGISYVDNVNLGKDEKSNIISFSELEKVILPITFGFVYFLMAFSVIYLIWNLIKTKKINWMVAFFTALIFANIFTLIVGAPEEEQRLFSASVPLVLLFFVYIIEKALNWRRDQN